MMNLTNTGERILLDNETPLMIARHFCAYKFAKDYIYDKRVIDIGCGEGYGAFYLAGFSKEVVGIDYDREVIDYASNKYKRDNLKFYHIDADDLASFAHQFDAVCCFQAIEHMHDPKKLLQGIKNILNENGIFICSTPNKLDASPKTASPLNRFHVKEYLIGEFRELLSGYFSEVKTFGLKRGKKLNFYRRIKKIGLFNYLPDFVNPAKRFYSQINCNNFIITKEALNSALDFIALCK